MKQVRRAVVLACFLSFLSVTKAARLVKEIEVANCSVCYTLVNPAYTKDTGIAQLKPGCKVKDGKITCRCGDDRYQFSKERSFCLSVYDGEGAWPYILNYGFNVPLMVAGTWWSYKLHVQKYRELLVRTKQRAGGGSRTLPFCRRLTLRVVGNVTLVATSFIGLFVLCKLLRELIFIYLPTTAYDIFSATFTFVVIAGAFIVSAWAHMVGQILHPGNERSLQIPNLLRNIFVSVSCSHFLVSVVCILVRSRTEEAWPQDVYNFMSNYLMMLYALSATLSLIWYGRKIVQILAKLNHDLKMHNSKATAKKRELMVVMRFYLGALGVWLVFFLALIGGCEILNLEGLGPGAYATCVSLYRLSDIAVLLISLRVFEGTIKSTAIPRWLLCQTGPVEEEDVDSEVLSFKSTASVLSRSHGAVGIQLTELTTQA